MPTENDIRIPRFEQQADSEAPMALNINEQISGKMMLLRNVQIDNWVKAYSAQDGYAISNSKSDSASMYIELAQIYAKED